jgi:hypothetical protein
MPNKSRLTRKARHQAMAIRLNTGSSGAMEQAVGAKSYCKISRKQSSKGRLPFVPDLDIFWGNYLKFNLTSGETESNLRGES